MIPAQLIQIFAYVGESNSNDAKAAMKWDGIEASVNGQRFIALSRTGHPGPACHTGVNAKQALGTLGKVSIAITTSRPTIWLVLNCD